jgi:hypothetical protein
MEPGGSRPIVRAVHLVRNRRPAGEILAQTLPRAISSGHGRGEEGGMAQKRAIPTKHGRRKGPPSKSCARHPRLAAKEPGMILYLALFTRNITSLCCTRYRRRPGHLHLVTAPPIPAQTNATLSSSRTVGRSGAAINGPTFATRSLEVARSQTARFVCPFSRDG